jgi:transposase
MSWAEITRKQYRREHLRHASDLMDEEWSMVEAHLPAHSHRGRPAKWEFREIVNAILYIAQTGCQWRMPPKDFPPFSTVQGYFYAWRDEGRRQLINHALVVQVREAMGREASPNCGHDILELR